MYSVWARFVGPGLGFRSRVAAIGQKRPFDNGCIYPDLFLQIISGLKAFSHPVSRFQLRAMLALPQLGVLLNSSASDVPIQGRMR